MQLYSIYNEMVFQMTKLNFIIFISLCIVNFEAIESDEITYNIEVDKSGKKQVIELEGGTFTLNDEYEVIVQGSSCTWRVDMKKATQVEEVKRGGTRNGSLMCNGWDIHHPNMPIPDTIILESAHGV
uniref:Uncharacterized protein n=1 Tax=Trichobilharzia regenti TaxID=157069 RepID=A0AA85KJJ9_TRIRE|nr:unnamed protein product [Trichobilharzia regenti]